MPLISLTFTQGAIAFAIIFALGVGLGFFIAVNSLEDDDDNT